MTNVEADGSVTTRSEGTIATGWDLILSQGGDILFYKPSSGDVAIGGIHELSVSRGLEIRKTHLAYFSPGWTNIVATND